MNLLNQCKTYYQQWLTLSFTMRAAILMIVGSVLAQLFIIMPMNRSSEALIQTIQTESDDVMWIKERAPLLRQVKPDNNTKTKASLLAIAESTSHDFAGQDKRLSEDSTSAVMFDFKNVSFDKLMGWFITLDKQSIKVSKVDMQVVEKSPGKVNARGRLSR